MFGIDGFEGVFTVVPVLFWAAVVVALGWVVRRAVRQGVVDARRQPPPSPAPSSSPSPSPSTEQRGHRGR